MKPSSRSRVQQPRPMVVTLFAALQLTAAALTAYFGLYAPGYLVPAACLLLQAALLWLGRGKTPFAGIMVLNQISGLILILVLAFGDGFGDRKLDISAVALLLNLATGGPLMGVLSLPLLGLLQFSSRLRDWFRASQNETLKEAFST